MNRSALIEEAEDEIQPEPINEAPNAANPELPAVLLNFFSFYSSF